MAWVASAVCGRLELDHELRVGEPRHSEERPGRLHAGGAEPIGDESVVLEHGVDVRGVRVEPDHVREVHVGRSEHCFQVVERERDLSGHVALVLVQIELRAKKQVAVLATVVADCFGLAIVSVEIPPRVQPGAQELRLFAPSATVAAAVTITTPAEHR